MKFIAIFFIVFAIVGAAYNMVKSWPDKYWIILMLLFLPGLIFSLWRLLFEKEIKEKISRKLFAILATVLGIAGASYVLVRSWPADKFWIIFVLLNLPGMVFSLWRLIFDGKNRDSHPLNGNQLEK